MQKHTSIELWSGDCAHEGWHTTYSTTVTATAEGISIEQFTSEEDPRGGMDHVVMSRSEAIDIAFAILRDCAPTLAEALEGLRGPAAAGADANTKDTDGQQWVHDLANKHINS